MERAVITVPSLFRILERVYAREGALLTLLHYCWGNVMPFQFYDYVNRVRTTSIYCICCKCLEILFGAMLNNFVLCIYVF